ncbi:MAG TPA: hypothetical protein VMW64_05320 [Dehalococcoidia bacterium]|nr:hypothetical protein [Dehalococcoidia bacterium]
MEEQKIKNLEEEFKVLKNQIRAVLLDIKEQLATGIQTASSAPSPAPWAGTVPASPQAENGVKVVREAPKEAEPGIAEMASGVAEKIETSGCATGRVPEASIAGVKTDNEGRVDLLTVSVLSQWLSRAAATVSKEQITKLVEIYDITGNLPPRLKQAILLLADLYADNDRDESEDVPASVSMQLLIELDSLLRYRTGALESVVLSMLLEKGQFYKKGG